jgi:Holliday junction resolvase RusA-like endonuclease
MNTATIELGPNGMRLHLPEAERPPDFECFVPGIPRPQGSKTPNRNGRGMRESSKYVKGWREEIVAYANSEWAYARSPRRPPLEGPLMLGVEFVFKRPGTRKTPGSHWHRCTSCKGRGGHVVKPGSSFVCGRDVLAHCKTCDGLGLLLRDNAPVYMTGVPDMDKCKRAVGDALKIARVVKDDSLFVRDHESGCKRYANPGEQPGAWIRIWRLA